MTQSRCVYAHFFLRAQLIRLPARRTSRMAYLINVYNDITCIPPPCDIAKSKRIISPRPNDLVFTNNATTNGLRWALHFCIAVMVGCVSSEAQGATNHVACFDSIAVTGCWWRDRLFAWCGLAEAPSSCCEAVGGSNVICGGESDVTQRWIGVSDVTGSSWRRVWLKPQKETATFKSTKQHHKLSLAGERNYY